MPTGTLTKKIHGQEKYCVKAPPRMRPTAEPVPEPAAQEQEAAEDERVGVDDPLQSAVGQVEVVLDRRQGNVHDRRVEDDHELRQADEDKDDPWVGGGASHGCTPVLRSLKFFHQC